MKHILTLVVALNTMYAVAQWTVQSIPAADRYDDICFLNDSVGWTVSSAGKIYKTINGGASWLLKKSTGKYLRSVEFATPMLGFAGSLDSSFYRTTDGGQTWTDIAGLIDPKPPGICGLSAPTPEVIYGCGIWSSPAYVVKSEDGGDSWTSMDLSAYASALVECHFINADTGFVSGMSVPATKGGVILYTENGGDTWTIKHQTLTPQDYIWKLQSPDGIHVFGSVEALPVTGNIRMVRSDDGGQNWSTEVIFEDYNYIQSIGFLTPMRGWTAGDADMYETVDGGATWEPSFFFSGSSYNRFVRINDSTAYMSGNKIYKYSEGVVAVPGEKQMLDEVHGLTVSPNPASDQLVIDLIIRSETPCRLQVFAADGALVETIIDERLPPSQQQLSVDISRLPPQLIYVILKTNEGMIHRRIVKQ